MLDELQFCTTPGPRDRKSGPPAPDSGTDGSYAGPLSDDDRTKLKFWSLFTPTAGAPKWEGIRGGAARSMEPF